MRQRRYLALILIIMVLSVPILSSCSFGGSPGAGVVAPDFTATDLQGRQVRLSDLRGKVVMLNFWATWCGYCRAEMPSMEKLWEKYRFEGFEVVALNVGEDKQTVQSFVNEYGLFFQTWLDQNESITTSYGVSGYPTSFFLDREGKIRNVVPGAMEYDQMVRVVESLVNE